MQSNTQALEPAKSSPPRGALWRRILLPRFSLRTLIILVTLFSFAAALFGNWIYKSERQKRVVAELHSITGAHVAYDDTEFNGR